MASQLDDVIITRAVSTRNRRPAPAPQQRAQRAKQEDTPPTRDNRRRVVITALLLTLFSVLLLIALFSYTARDAANSELSFHDISGVLKGDREVSERIDTTHNWLGLLGAVIANAMYNQTFGITALMIPLLMLWWSKELFTQYQIARRTLERSGLILLACALAAGWFGTMQQITWLPTLPREFSGAVGKFLAFTLSHFIGTIGSLLVTSVTLFLCVSFAIDLDLVHTFHKFKLLWAKILDGSIILWHKVKHYDREEVTLSVEAESPQESTPQKKTRLSNGSEKGAEPARIIRRNAPIDKSLQDSLFEGEPKIIRPDPAVNKSNESSVDAQVNKSPNGTNGRNGASDKYSLPLSLADTAVPINIRKVSLTQQNEQSEASKNIAAASLEAIGIRREPLLDPTSVNQGPPEVSTSSAPLRLQVEEIRFEDQVDNIERPDIYDEEIDYTPPGMELLDVYSDEHVADDKELKMNARILQEKLETFKIKIEDVTVTPGPVITQYEFVPAAGVKISQIESLSDDIALALKARGIRIIAPVPGKGTVGVEIPNHKPSIVHFSSIIKSKAFNDNDKQLPIALGKTIIGETFCTDLSKLPHLLIAGSTGSGKSVGINTILMSLIFKMHPRDLKFVILDPKKVEMTLYAGLKNHFLATSPDIEESIVTTPQNSVLALKAVVLEMEQRYELLASAGQRKITDYNKKVQDGKIVERDGRVLRPLPYIVVIIDELADLMITARNDVEEPIIRLAQLARAVGIHLVVATQRPSVDVITGLIKANFPARLAYQVASKVDSRTILDSSGAEQLLGNGDMLFTHGGVKPMRLQNSFVSTDEVEAITSFIEKQRGYSSPYMLPSVLINEGAGKVMSGDFDPLFKEAAGVIIHMQQGSVSLLQRRLKVGYSRAARIMDELEAAGVVGPFDGSKARAVLMDSEAELERVL